MEKDELNVLWGREVGVLEHMMEAARSEGYKAIALTEAMQHREREIERLEGAEILQQTSATGAVNGSNESTRKKQTASLLQTLKSQPGEIQKLYAEQEEDRVKFTASQHLRDQALDAIVICKMKIAHVDILLGLT